LEREYSAISPLEAGVDLPERSNQPLETEIAPSAPFSLGFRRSKRYIRASAECFLRSKRYRIREIPSTNAVIATLILGISEFRYLFEGS